jgi:two-component system OmpR family sensor kinase
VQDGPQKGILQFLVASMDLKSMGAAMQLEVTCGPSGRRSEHVRQQKAQRRTPGSMTPRWNPPPVNDAASVAAAIQDLLRRIADLSEAVAARDTFIAVAAHELRNPMTPILGQVDLLLSAIKAGRCSPEQVEQRLERIQRTVRQYMKRAVVLLDVSRITTGKFRLEPVACDLAALLREVVDEFTEAAQHAGVTIQLTAPESLGGIWDRLAVEQIVDNLVSNAIKYGGRTPVEVSLFTVDRNVQIHVRDHGKGVPPQDRERVFERFERAVGQNEYRSGFGVGLWVVGQLVEAMNGTISIDQAAGGGALFMVTLPTNPEEAPP